jgi:hypothetical protein
MIEGVLRLRDGRTAAAGPDGWRSEDAELAGWMGRLFPPPASEAGTPWVRAFHEAADVLGARILQAPEPDPYPPPSGQKSPSAAFAFDPDGPED